MRRLEIASLLNLAAILLATGAYAAGPLIEPGEWELTSTTEAPSFSQPVVQTVKRCVEDSEIDPLRLVMQTHGCKVLRRSLSGNVLKWKMECPNNLGVDPFEGEGQLTSYGRRLEGNMTMGTNVGDSPIEVGTHWTGRLVGGCELE
jgi:hypothetical protein